MIYSENLLLCIAIPFAVALVFARGNGRVLVSAFLAGMLTCLLSAYISGFVGLVAQVSEVDTAVIFSPVIEESMKLLPLLFFRYVVDHREDRMIVCAIGVGTGFATFENCCYLLAVGTESLRFTMVRGLAVGVMHVTSMIMLAICVLFVRRYRIPALAGTVGALSMSAIFHALYNLLVSEPGLPSALGYVLPLVTAAVLYVPYLRMTAQRQG